MKYLFIYTQSHMRGGWFCLYIKIFNYINEFVLSLSMIRATTTMLKRMQAERFFFIIARHLHANGPKVNNFAFEHGVIIPRRRKEMEMRCWVIIAQGILMMHFIINKFINALCTAVNFNCRDLSPIIPFFISFRKLSILKSFFNCIFQ